MPALRVDAVCLRWGGIVTAALSSVVGALQELVPLEWAEEWDNVGLLVEPPGRSRVRRVLLTIDLLPAVLDEAVQRKADLVVAYHPPIFTPLRSLTMADPMRAVVMRCVQRRIAIYSPHTALDAVAGGVNDWLADGVGEGERVPLVRGPQHATAPEGVGQGRSVRLTRPVTVSTLASRLKKHLGVKHVRIARGAAEKIERIALCAGAGGSVLVGCDADVWVTGEMRHHDVLAAVERGVAVILCEHTNTERGYLSLLARSLRKALGGGVEVAVSRADREPLATG